MEESHSLSITDLQRGNGSFVAWRNRIQESSERYEAGSEEEARAFPPSPARIIILSHLPTPIPQSGGMNIE